MLPIWTYTNDDFTYHQVIYAKVEKPHLSLHVISIVEAEDKCFFVSGTKNEVNILLQDYHVYKGRDKWSPRCSSEGVENSDLYDV